MGYRTSLIIISVVCGPLSLIGSLILIYSYTRFKKLKKRASSFIVFMSVGQILYDLVWITANPWILEQMTESGCRAVSSIATYGFTLIWVYNLALSVSIFRSVKNRDFSKLKTKLWHIVSHSLGVLYVIIANVDNSSNNDFERLTCFPNDKVTEFLVDIPGVSAFIVSAFLSLYVNTQVTSKTLCYHIGICLIYSLCLGPIGIIHLVGFFHLLPDGLVIVIVIQPFLFIASLSGFLAFISRILDKRLFLKLTKRFRNRQRNRSQIQFSSVYLEQSGNSITSCTNSLSSDSGYSLLFKDIHTEVIYRQNAQIILSTISYIFENSQETELLIEDQSRHWRTSAVAFGIQDIRVEEYMFEEFQQIRNIENISLQSLVKSLNLEANSRNLEERTVNPAGTGTGFLFFTHDKKIILKSINKSEIKAFKKIFPEYYSKIISGCCTHIARIYGAFRIKFKGTGAACIIYQNILESTDKPWMFDMKGSSANRRVFSKHIKNIDEMPRDIVYKDVDFSSNVGYIRIPSSERQALLNTLMSDIKMFESCGIMDYSLLLAIQDIDTDYEFENCLKYRYIADVNSKKYFIYVAIIDYLQVFNFSKKTEMRFKTFKYDKAQVSSIPPTPYMLRFQSFIQHIFHNL